MTEKIRKDLEKLKVKLGSTKLSGLSLEAKRILQLYAQGYHDWCAPEYRKPWQMSYRQALRDYAPQFSNPEGPSSKTLYQLLFMIQFRGGKDTEKAEESMNEFWLLARQVAPKATEELLSDKDGGREFLAAVDKVLAEPDETSKDAESAS